MLRAFVPPLSRLFGPTNPSNRQLLILPSVIFAGYKVPHPLEARFVLKVQTDGTLTPIQAVQEACQGLILTLSKIKKEFGGELMKARAREGDGMGLGEGGFDGGYAF